MTNALAMLVLIFISIALVGSEAARKTAIAFGVMVLGSVICTFLWMLDLNVGVALVMFATVAVALKVLIAALNTPSGARPHLDG